MNAHAHVGLRAYPCPEDTYSLEDKILDEIDELQESTVAAYAEFCANKLDLPLALIHALVQGLGLRRRWEVARSSLGRIQPELDEVLNEIVWSIDKLQAEFIEHHAAQLRSKAEQIKQEAA